MARIGSRGATMHALRNLLLSTSAQLPESEANTRLIRDAQQAVAAVDVLLQTLMDGHEMQTMAAQYYSRNLHAENTADEVRPDRMRAIKAMRDGIEAAINTCRSVSLSEDHEAVDAASDALEALRHHMPEGVFFGVTRGSVDSAHYLGAHMEAILQNGNRFELALRKAHPFFDMDDVGVPFGNWMIEGSSLVKKANGAMAMTLDLPPIDLGKVIPMDLGMGLLKEQMKALLESCSAVQRLQVVSG